MNSFDRDRVFAVCRHYGPELNVGPDLDAIRVALAIASNESSVGANCGPRHEPGYDVDGAIWRNSALQQKLVTEFGPAAACSYGPWQMMFINFEHGISPSDLLSDLDLCARNFVKFFNGYVIATRKAVSLGDIGQVWNAGHVRAIPSPDVERYCEHLATAYAQFASPKA